MTKAELDYILGAMLDSQKNVSDLNITADKPLQVETSGELVPVRIDPSVERLTPFQTETIAMTIINSNRRLLEESGLNAGALAESAAAWETEGRTLSWLIVQSPEPQVLGLFAFGDTLKPGALQAVQQLSARNISSHLLTGDNRGSANVVAEALGIHDVHAEVLPADKAATVAALKQTGVVAMVGDGINDAPALAAADIGIAMGGGTDVAMHAAGITLMRGDPRLVPAALEISRKTYAKIRQNLFWAFVYNLIGIPLAAFGLLNPVLAGAAMALSSVSVVSNALLLKTWKPKDLEDNR